MKICRTIHEIEIPAHELYSYHYLHGSIRDSVTILLFVKKSVSEPFRTTVHNYNKVVTV